MHAWLPWIRRPEHDMMDDQGAVWLDEERVLAGRHMVLAAGQLLAAHVLAWTLIIAFV
ncbi:MAG: hypothetical protein Q8O14_05725 [bacterium]|nr:hypothetical protein [bacterium]